MTKAQFLAFSLPFKLVCQVTDKGETKFSELSGVYFDGSAVFCDIVESNQGFSSIKPVLRPISDLTREIKGKIGLVELAKISFPETEWTLDLSDFAIKVAYDKKNPQVWFEYNNGFYAGFDSYGDYHINNQIELFEYLFSNHYDIAGLINQGKAIDINTLSGFSFY